MKQKIFIPVILFFIHFTGVAQETAGYRAGFKTLKLIDSTRIYKVGSPETDPLHYRPVDVDIWYPTSERNGERLLFEDLYRLHEERANSYQDETDYTGLSDEFILYLAAGFGVEAQDGRRLLKVKTDSYKSGSPAIGEFPMIIYLAGYNGMGWESYRLLEKLAENGFIVLSISSVGRYPGDMTNSIHDTMQQVYDAEFALEKIRKNKQFNVDFDEIGILGLSWGSVSGVILLDRFPAIKAFASLDGTDVFYFGDTEEDDTFLTEIYDADIIHPEKSTAAYWYMESGDKLNEFTPSDEYHFFKMTNAQKNYLRFENSKHEDFASIAWALKSSEEQVQIYEQLMKSTTLFFQKHLQQKNDFNTYYTQLIDLPKVTDTPFDYSMVLPEGPVLSGKIIDSESLASLPYVNVGVMSKEKGTVSDDQGVFDLQLSESNLKDTLKFSMIGYKPKAVPVNTILNKRSHIEISLQKEVSDLEAVVVTAEKLKKKTLGNKTESKFIGHLFYYEQLGKEMGIKMNVKKRPHFVNSFNFHISYNRFSAKSFFRLNIYRIVNGKPTENILKENIIIPVDSKQTGMVTTDLRAYDIVLTEDVIVTLEWVDTEGEVKPTEALVISVGLLTGGTYERDSKESRMKKKLKGLGLGFTMNVSY